MNWGKGIAAIYIVFVVLIGGMVYITTQQKFDLVADDYYDQELKFQKKIDATTNANQLQNKVDFALTETDLIVLFPSQLNLKSINGNLLCYKSSDSKKDVKIDLNLDDTGKQLIERKIFASGLYTLQLSFNIDGKDYFMEKEIKF